MSPLLLRRYPTPLGEMSALLALRGLGLLEFGTATRSSRRRGE
ncbi:MAG: hypothetical protein QM772_17765 [Ottowia sp.]